MAQVARVLERDAERQRVAFRARQREQLRDVDDVLGPVILQVRAAAGRVRDDVVVAGQRLDQLARAGDALVEPAGVRVQRAAAALRPRNVRVETFRLEDPGGRPVDVPEDHALDAARE